MALSHSIFLPFVGGSRPAPAPEPVDGGQLCAQWAALPGQCRPQMIVEPLLLLYAVWKASDIITHKIAPNHVASTGEGPNDALRRMGVWLPDWYGAGPDANQCEALAYNVPLAKDALPGLLKSPAHSAHILASEWTYYPQILVGAAWAYNTQPAEGEWATVGVFVSVPRWQEWSH